MKTLQKILFVLLPFIIIAAGITHTGCNIYKFQDINVPDTIRVVKVNYIENRASYVNPQLSPQLTDKLRQKIVSQTRLKQTAGDNADWEISCEIRDYSFSTAGVANNQSATNRINVSVHVILNNIKGGETKEYDVSRNFDFSANQSLQQAEASLLTEMIRGLTDDIFNRLFSDW